MKSLSANLFWVALGKYSQLIVSFIVTAVLARVLSPAEFGIVASVLIINNFLYTLAESGISSAVIQKKVLNESDKNTFFLFGFLFGLVLYLIVVLLAGAISNFFSISDIKIIIPYIAINFILIGVLGVPLGILRREFKFEKIAKSDLISVIISGGVSVYLAFNGFGYWSLVFQQVIQLTAKFFLCLYYSKYKFSFKFIKMEPIIFLKRYSGFLILFNSINYWTRNFDNLIIAKSFGEKALGIYSQAYRLMLLPSQLIGSLMNSVLHSYLAKEYNSNKNIEPYYSKIFTLSLLVCSPISAFMLFYPSDTVILFWGDQWLESASILQYLSILALIQPALMTTGDVYKSTNTNKLLFKVGLVNTVILVCSIYIGSLFSVEGVALAYGLSYFCFVMPITIYTVYKFALKRKVSYLLRELKFELPYIILIFTLNWVLSILLLDQSILYKIAINGFLDLILMYIWYLFRFKNIIAVMKSDR